MRGKYKLTRVGRLAVVYGTVNDIQIGRAGATMTQVARSMGLQPSSYVQGLLVELETEGVIRHKNYVRENGGLRREWFIATPEEKERRINDAREHSTRITLEDA